MFEVGTAGHAVAIGADACECGRVVRRWPSLGDGRRCWRAFLKGLVAAKAGLTAEVLCAASSPLRSYARAAVRA